MKYPLTLHTWSAQETKAVLKVIRSQQFTASLQTKKFEQVLAKKFGSRFAIMTNSGSMANLLAISALKYTQKNSLQSGDEVIAPALAWSTTYSPLLQNNFKLKLVDINLDTLNIDLALLQKAISPQTKAILAVNILGNPAPLLELKKICQQRKIVLLEDNCESMGAKLGNQYTGTFGDISTFSTFYSHHIHTIEGGFALTDSSEYADILRCLRAHGWARDISPSSALLKNASIPTKFPEAYNFLLPGFNGRPTELSAAIGLVQMKKLDKYLAIRRRNADLFQKTFKQDDRFILQKENGNSSWFAFTIILNPKMQCDRNSIFQSLRKHNIQFRLITGGNFLEHNMKKYFNYSTYGDLPNVSVVHNRGFFVGNYPKNISREIKFLYKILDKAVR